MATPQDPSSSQLHHPWDAGHICVTGGRTEEGVRMSGVKRGHRLTLRKVPGSQGTKSHHTITSICKGCWEVVPFFWGLIPQLTVKGAILANKGNRYWHNTADPNPSGVSVRHLSLPGKRIHYFTLLRTHKNVMK